MKISKMISTFGVSFLLLGTHAALAGSGGTNCRQQWVNAPCGANGYAICCQNSSGYWECSPVTCAAIHAGPRGNFSQVDEAGNEITLDQEDLRAYLAQ